MFLVFRHKQDESFLYRVFTIHLDALELGRLYETIKVGWWFVTKINGVVKIGIV